ncbi:MAG: iron-sulfur cluster assembly accessory protein [Planctomycetota bacterium]|nr:MAG: iron-sulfur cluster assembly accessory protein [Planctomycetota bacterium]
MAETQQETVVTLTEAAQEAARRFLAAEEGKVLRVGVTSGGCSGFSYLVTTDVRKEDDLVQRHEGFEVVIDPISRNFLRGSTLDYVDEIGHAGFRFENPQAKSGCGCGMSFDVE